MNVREVMEILKECDPERNIYIRDTDGTAQLVTAIGDMQHVNTGLVGVSIPDDIYMMTSAQSEEFTEDEEEE